MFDYVSRTNNDLDIKRNEILFMINKEDDDWWWVKSTDTGKEGYVPCNYISEINTER